MLNTSDVDERRMWKLEPCCCYYCRLYPTYERPLAMTKATVARHCSESFIDRLQIVVTSNPLTSTASLSTQPPPSSACVDSNNLQIELLIAHIGNVEQNLGFRETTSMASIVLKRREWSHRAGSTPNVDTKCFHLRKATTRSWPVQTCSGSHRSCEQARILRCGEFPIH